MKIGIGVLLLLVALLFASPFYVGKKIEDGAQQQVAESQSSGYKYTLDVDRGYRSSVLKYGIEVVPTALSTDYGLSTSKANAISEALSKGEIKVQVDHGPFLTGDGFALGWADINIALDRSTSPDIAEVLEIMEVEEFFTASTRVSLSGTGNYEFSVPRLIYVGPVSGDNVRFNGLTGQGSYSDFGRQYSMEAESQGGIVAAQFAYIALGPFSSSIEADMDEDYRYWGDMDSDLDVDSIIYSSEQANISMFGVKASGDMEDGDTAELGDVEYALELESFSSGSLKVEDVETSFAFSNISKQFLEDYMAFEATMDREDPEGMEAEILNFVESELPALLRSSPGFSIPKFAFSHEGRTFDVGIDLAIDGGKLTDDDVVLQNVPMMLLPALDAELILDADESLVNYLVLIRAENSVDASLAGLSEEEVTPELRQAMIDQQVATMLNIAEGQGFIVNENGRIKSEITFSESTLDVNGRMMPLPF